MRRISLIPVGRKASFWACVSVSLLMLLSCGESSPDEAEQSTVAADTSPAQLTDTSASIADAAVDLSLSDSPSCLVSGAEDDEVRCTLELVSQDGSFPRAASLQLLMEWDTTRAAFVGLSCAEDPDDLFDDPCAFQDRLRTQHSIATMERSSDGAQAFVFVHMSQPDTAITDVNVGEQGAQVLDAVFSLRESIDPAAPLAINLLKVAAGSTTSQKLDVSMDGWTVITAAPQVRANP